MMQLITFKSIQSNISKIWTYCPESPLKWFFKEDKYFKGLGDFELSNQPKEIFRETYSKWLC